MFRFLCSNLRLFGVGLLSTLLFLAETPLLSFNPEKDLPGFKLDAFVRVNSKLTIPHYIADRHDAFHDVSAKSVELDGKSERRTHNKLMLEGVYNSLVDSNLPGLSWLYGMPGNVDWRGTLNSSASLQRMVDSILSGPALPWNSVAAKVKGDFSLQQEILKATLVQEFIIASQYSVEPLLIPGLSIKTFSPKQSEDLFVETLVRRLERTLPNVKKDSKFLKSLKRMYSDSKGEMNEFFNALDQGDSLERYKFTVRNDLGWNRPEAAYDDPDIGELIQYIDSECPQSLPGFKQLAFIRDVFDRNRGNVPNFLALIRAEKNPRKILNQHKAAIQRFYQRKRPQPNSKGHYFNEADAQASMKKKDFTPHRRGTPKHEQMKGAYRLIAAQNRKILSGAGYRTLNGVTISREDLGIDVSISDTLRYTNKEFTQNLRKKGKKKVNLDTVLPVSAEARASSVRVEVVDETTNDGIVALSDEGYRKIGFLNCANRHHKGGGYINGANAQEEEECRTTTLYPALDGQVYPFGHHEAFYTPSVRLFRKGYQDKFALLDKPIEVSVVSSVAYNMPRENPSAGEFFWGTYFKVRQSLEIFREQKVDGVVLAALGCGAFRNDVEVVARIFAYLLSHEFKDAFKRVRFSILSNSTTAVFKKHMQCYGLMTAR